MWIIAMIYQNIIEMSEQMGAWSYFIGIVLVSTLLGIAYIRMEDKNHSHT